MRSLHVLRRHLGNERGIGMFATAMWITAFFALTAVGVDVGRIAFTAAEVQSVAEVAATAAATTVIKGGTAATAKADADGVVAKNIVNGRAAAPADFNIEIGTVDSAGNFTAGGASPSGASPNAAKATATAMVTNLFAGVINSPNTTVTKTAVATMATISSGAPTLPLALDAVCFDANCTANASYCPTLSTHENTACWTGYTAGSTDRVIDSFVPASGSCGGGGGSPGIFSVGTSINLTNGALANVYRDVLCLWCANPNAAFLVPVVNNGACDGSGICTGSQNVIGFASVKIDHFVDQFDVTVAFLQNGSPVGCGSNPKGIVLKSFRNVEEPGGVGGCVKCGTGFVRLVG